METNSLVLIQVTGNGIGNGSAYTTCKDNHNTALMQFLAWSNANNRTFVSMTTSQAVIDLGNDNQLFTKTSQILLQKRDGDFDSNGVPLINTDYLVE